MLRIASFILLLIAWFPAPVRNFLAWILAPVLQYLVRYRRSVIRQNLLSSFPQKSSNEIARIEQNFYRQFTRLLLEINAGRALTKREMKAKVRYKNLEILNSILDKGKSVVLVFGHYTNWEWTVGLPLHLNYPVLAIYHPLTNRLIDETMFQVRARFGTIPVPMKSVYKELVRFDKNRQPVVSYFIADQSPNRSQIKEYFQFLNQPTGVFQGTERIASKLGHAVVFLKMKMTKPGYYEAEFIPLVEDASKCTENEITRKHLAQLEHIIQEKPEWWLWTHKRWKHKPLPGDLVHS